MTAVSKEATWNPLLKILFHISMKCSCFPHIAPCSSRRRECKKGQTVLSTQVLGIAL